MTTTLDSATENQRISGWGHPQVLIAGVLLAIVVTLATLALVSVTTTNATMLPEAQAITTSLNTKSPPAGLPTAKDLVAEGVVSKGYSQGQAKFYIASVTATKSLYLFTLSPINASARACITYKVASATWSATSGACQ
jgi:hypothetical protein